MLRTLLITAALLTASGSALAHSDYRHGRVVSVEPHFVVSFGSRHHDGFRVRYESGGSHYWTHTRYRPGPVIVLPPPHRVTHTHLHHYRDRGQYRDHDRGWKDRDHDRGWKGRGDGWHGDRRDNRHDNRRHYRR